jgi:hypothetical protein
MIPKRSGGFREIAIVPKWQRHYLAYVVSGFQSSPGLNEALNEGIKLRHLEGVVHGFRPGHSPLTNAWLHRKRRFTVCLDISYFFDSVTREVLELVVKNTATKAWTVFDYIKRVTVSLNEYLRRTERKVFKRPLAPEDLFPLGRAMQGLPTSPALANLAALPMDDEIVFAIREQSTRFLPRNSVVYTRYADDLAFSFDHPGFIQRILKLVPEIARRHGFSINRKKTRVFCEDAGNRVICGVAVRGDRLLLPREARRRFRAAVHRYGPKSDQAIGHLAWERALETLGPQMGTIYLPYRTTNIGPARIQRQSGVAPQQNRRKITIE